MADDIEERIFQRMDLGGELGRMLDAVVPLARNGLARAVVSAATGGKVDLSAFAAIDHDVHSLVSATARALTAFSPLGWAPTMFAPTDVYDHALDAYESSGSPELAEAVLVDGWNEPGRLELRLGHLSGFGSADEELDELFRARHRLVQKAIAHHRSEAYEASVPIALAQADGVVLELTNKYLFVHGSPKHLLDAETLAGMPEGLQYVAPLFAESNPETTVSGDLRRHGILHGRELGYDTRVNSTKALVLLMAVMDWAEPRVRRRMADRQSERAAKHAGSSDVDARGRRLDRRGIKEAKAALEWVAMVQFARLARDGRYAADLTSLPPEWADQDRQQQRKLQITVSDDGQAFAVIRKVDDQDFWFGVAVTAEGRRWLYADSRQPSLDVAAGGWAGDFAFDAPIDWDRND